MQDSVLAEIVNSKLAEIGDSKRGVVQSFLELKFRYPREFVRDDSQTGQ